MNLSLSNHLILFAGQWSFGAISSIWPYIVQTPSFLKGGGGVNSIYLPQRGEIRKIEKRGWKYSAGAGLFKREDGAFPI